VLFVGGVAILHKLQPLFGIALFWRPRRLGLGVTPSSPNRITLCMAVPTGLLRMTKAPVPCMWGLFSASAFRLFGFGVRRHFAFVGFEMTKGVL